MNLELNNLQWLICHKTPQTKPNKSTNECPGYDYLCQTLPMSVLVMTLNNLSMRFQ